MKGRYTSTAMVAAAGVILAGPAWAQWDFQIGDSGAASAAVASDDGNTVFSLGCAPGEPNQMDFVISMTPSAPEGPTELTLTIAIGGDEFTLTANPLLWDEGFVPMLSVVPWEGELQDEIRARLRSGSRVRLSGDGLRTETFTLRGSSAALRELESTCLEFWETQSPSDGGATGDDAPVADGGAIQWAVEETDEGGAIAYARQPNGRVFAVECGGSVLPDHMQLAILTDGSAEETTPVELDFDIDGEAFTANANVLPQDGDVVVLGTQYEYLPLVREELFGRLRDAATVTVEGGAQFEGGAFAVAGADAAMDDLEQMCVSLGHITLDAEGDDDPAPSDGGPVSAGRTDSDWEFSADRESALAVTRSGDGRAFGLECVEGLAENHLQLAVVVYGSEDGTGADTFTFAIDGEEYTANADFFPQDDGETVLMSTQYNYNPAFRDLILDGIRNGSTFELLPGERYEGYSFGLSDARSAVNDVESACIRLGFLTAAEESGDAPTAPDEPSRDAPPPATREGTGEWVLEADAEIALALVETDDERAFGFNCADNDPGVMRIFAYLRAGRLVPSETDLTLSFRGGDGDSYTGSAETVRDETDIVGFVARYTYDDGCRNNILGEVRESTEVTASSPVAREDYTFDITGAEQILVELDQACAEVWGTEPLVERTPTAPDQGPSGGTKASEGAEEP